MENQEEKMVRPENEKRNLRNRLSKIEGQVRGIKNMVLKDAYCTDLLIQIAAVESALSSVSKIIVASHMEKCVAPEVMEGKEEKLNELLNLLPKVIK